MILILAENVWQKIQKKSADLLTHQTNDSEIHRLNYYKLICLKVSNVAFHGVFDFQLISTFILYLK